VTQARAWRRRAAHAAYRAACAAALALAVAPLVASIAYAVPRAGAAVLNLVAHGAASPAGAGLVDAAAGSAAVVGLAALVGVPIGVLAGVFAAESARGGRLARAGIDLLGGVPAVVVGLVAHVAIVLPTRRHGLLAGAVALSLVVIPPVARGTDDLLRLVPRALRDAATSLGLPRWRVALFALLPAARRGVAATAALAVSRALGETAPLLLTTFHVGGFPDGLTGPTPTLPVAIWTQASSADERARSAAWLAALVLLAAALALRAAALLLRRTDEEAPR
jgi:phosphate transport system permease protein